MERSEPGGPQLSVQDHRGPSSDILLMDTNAPSTAMRVTKYVLDAFIGKTFWAYLDDITLLSDTFENHVRDIRQVCQRLQDHHIRASPFKCNFFTDRLPLLGHVIDDQGIHANPENTGGIQDWHTPKLKKELKTFIGVVIYHAQSLPHVTGRDYWLVSSIV